MFCYFLKTNEDQIAQYLALWPENLNKDSWDSFKDFMRFSESSKGISSFRVESKFQ